MNHSSENGSDNTLSQVTIQKLVDGEFDHQSRSQLLAGLPDDSREWRKIALAFTENQVFTEALNSPSQAKVVLRRETTPASRDTDQRSSFWVAGLAASLLLGFLFGFAANDSPARGISQAGLDAAPRAMVEKSDAVSDSNFALADALSRSVVPVPDEFRRALRKAGYSIQDRQTITNVDLPSGGQIELPTRKVNVTFVGLSSFQ